MGRRGVQMELRDEMDGVLLIRRGIVNAGDLLPTTSQARCFHGVKEEATPEKGSKDLRLFGATIVYTIRRTNSSLIPHATAPLHGDLHYWCFPVL